MSRTWGGFPGTSVPSRSAREPQEQGCQRHGPWEREDNRPVPPKRRCRGLPGALRGAPILSLGVGDKEEDAICQNRSPDGGEEGPGSGGGNVAVTPPAPQRPVARGSGDRAQGRGALRLSGPPDTGSELAVVSEPRRG